MSLSRMASVDYLVDHVAASDGRATGPGASAMTRYYTSEGYPPGTWLGRGLEALGAENMVGSEVTEAQLRELFEQSRSPFDGRQLGRPPAKYPTRQERIDRRVGKLPDTLTPEARRALVEKITAEEKQTKTRTAVAGFDLTFSVPKSVSALWALAPAPVQEQLYLAHRAALTATFERIEAEAAYTRMGAHGVRRVRATGLIAAAFDHWDSRKGDPQLHTHVTVANRVQGPDGRWRTLDSATLHKAAVAYSETYNLLLADEITRRIGLTWDHRERQAGSNRRAARELSPVPDALIAAYSQRSADIEAAVDTAISTHVERTGGRPSANAINRIRQHLTLTTRDTKKAPNLAESVLQWQTTAAHVLDDDPSTWAATVTEAAATVRPGLLRSADVHDELVGVVAMDVVDAVAGTRSTWTRWNLSAETMRQLAGRNHQYATVAQAIAVRDRVVAAAEALSILLTPPEVGPVPDSLREPDGASPFTAPEVFTSAGVLRAEDDLLRLADDRTGPAVSADRADRIAAEPLPDRGYPLAVEDQAPAAVQIVTSGRVVDVLVGPAGTGKTTTMAGVRVMWEAEHGPGTVIGLAPSAVAAQVLADDLGVVTDNTAQWIAQQVQQDNRAQRVQALEDSVTRAGDQPRAGDLRRALARAKSEFDRWRLQPGQLLVVDEAGMADTFTLAHLARQAGDAGAKLLLVGDPCQLSAVQTGGAFGLLCGSRPDPPTLTQVRRFVEPDGTRRTWEEKAADRLRSGDSTALREYDTHGRVRSGDQDQMADDAYNAWLTETRTGLTSVLIAADNDTVVELNQRARTDLISAGQVDDTATAPVRNALSVGRGDVIVTRRIDRTQPDGTPRTARGGDGFVRNGQRWGVERAHRDGSLTVRLHTADATGTAPIRLSAAYVRDHVDLGYATTAHRAQGLTVDTSHVLADALTQREAFYVAMTRGRYRNTAYLVLDPAATVRGIVDHPIGGPADQDSWTTQQVAESISNHSSADTSAHETIRAEQDRPASIRQLADEADAIAAYAHEMAAAELLLTVFGDRPAIRQLLDDEHFPELAQAIRRAHHAGMDIAGELPRIVPAHSFETITAQRLAIAIRVHLRSRPTHGWSELMAGIIVDATIGLSDPQMLDALQKRYDLIEQRADSLADAAIETNQSWATALRKAKRPDQSGSILRIVAAYRERWDITGDAPLGPRPDRSADRAHHGDYQRLMAMLTQSTTRRAPTTVPEYGLDRTTRGRDL